MRPRTLDEVVGQPALLGPGGFLRAAVDEDRVPSMVLYGPPGTGKTTLAMVIAGTTEDVFEDLSAVSATLADVRAVVARAQDRLAAGRRTVLFLDEIHRFNKAQQDALLPVVENGLVTLIGATTQNPYYEINAALISRLRVLILEELSHDDLSVLIDRALGDSERGLGGRVGVEEEAREALIARAGGDARAALNLLEQAAVATADGGAITAQAVMSAAGGRPIVYDRAGDAHYDTISAYIKSLRGSDPDAALYYLAVMLAGGEDPRYIARRLVVQASEDVGNADPTALALAVAAAHAVELVGLPEARINLAQASVYVALAPKSNASYVGINRAQELVEREGPRRPPLALRDSSRPNATYLGHGEGYVYPHDHPSGVVPGSLLPEGLEETRLFTPGEHGPEAELSTRLRRLRGEPDEPDGPVRPF
jgi:putative ATPase